MKKVGIFGGTFDPPHLGHLVVAQEVLSALHLDEIWFIPSNIPPHKNRSLTNRKDRIEMVRKAIENNPSYFLNTIEFEREGPSYTVDTMEILTEKYPLYDFYFIIGADMVEYLPKWQQIEQLVQLVKFVGVKRPSYSIESKYPIIQIEVPQIEISSSMIRNRFATGKNTKYLLPESVKKYIEENQIYGSKRSLKDS